jgi:high-affinity Fe2+/Pb2+ permease
MKHMGWVLFFAANELPALTLVMGGKEPAGTTAIGAVGFAVGLFILWIFVRIGMFKDLKIRHYLLILICVAIALVSGYMFARG